MELLYSLAHNLLMILSIIGIGSYLAIKTPRRYSQVVWGAVFGLATIIMISHRFEVIPGYLIDFRNITVSLAGVAGGAVGACVTVAIAGAYRIIEGDAGTFQGVVGIALYGLIGVLLRRCFFQRLSDSRFLLLLGVLLAVLILIVIVFLPPRNHLDTIVAAQNLAMPLLVLNPIGVLLCYKLYFYLKQSIPRIILLENLFRTSPIQFITIGSQGKITFASQNLENNAHYYEMIAIVQEMASRVLTTNEEIYIETTIPGADNMLYYAFKAVPYLGVHSEKGVLVVTNNITTQRIMEQQMTKLDRLNIIGQMAASVAHEVRNPLTAARGFIQYISGKSTDYQQQLAVVTEEIDRANGIINNFLAVARNRFVEMELCSLNSIIQSIYPIIEAEALKRGVTINVSLDPAIPMRQFNTEEIKQLLYNLVLNGFDAMDQTHTKVLRISTVNSVEALLLNIEDTGCGMTEKQLAQLFEPFYTTKKEGTGLGLAVCHSIVERHKGWIRASSEPGTGTRFTIYFG